MADGREAGITEAHVTGQGLLAVTFADGTVKHFTPEQLLLLPAAPNQTQEHSKESRFFAG